MTRNEIIAAALVVLSCLLYASLLVLPFLGISVAAKATVATVLVCTGEGTFWIGAVVAGREVVRRYRSRLWPSQWFRRAEDEPVTPATPAPEPPGPHPENP